MKIILAMIITLSVSVANAVTVRGGPSCSDWLRERQISSNSLNYNELWLLGYMSGLAVGLNTDVLKNTVNSSIMGWIDNYCRSNSLHNLEQAGSELFFELKRQKGLP